MKLYIPYALMLWNLESRKVSILKNESINQQFIQSFYRYLMPTIGQVALWASKYSCEPHRRNPDPPLKGLTFSLSEMRKQTSELNNIREWQRSWEKCRMMVG